MSLTKPKIYNLALSAMLLAKEVSDVATDTSNEVRVLNTFWDVAFESTLQDLDLDSLSTPITLELLATLTDDPWAFVYKYPSNCVFFRRLESKQVTDHRGTHIEKRTGMYDSKKAIFTNEDEAVAECIPKNIPLEALSPMAGLAVAYRLAILSTPLITGKGAKALTDTIKTDYIFAKSEAQRTDALENFNYEADDLRSEFARLWNTRH